VVGLLVTAGTICRLVTAGSICSWLLQDQSASWLMQAQSAGWLLQDQSSGWLLQDLQAGYCKSVRFSGHFDPSANSSVRCPAVPRHKTLPISRVINTRTRFHTSALGETQICRYISENTIHIALLTRAQLSPKKHVDCSFSRKPPDTTLLVSPTTAPLTACTPTLHTLP
jgi:hypothetical protein